MRSRVNDWVLAHWEGLRQGRETPDQSDIDPNALTQVLSQLFFLESAPSRIFVYRLAGASITERYKSELRGQNYLKRWNPKYRTRLTDILFQSLSAGSPLCLNSIGAGKISLSIAESETILLPMTSGTIRRDRFLCATEILTEVKEPYMRPMIYEHLVTAEFIQSNTIADLGTKRA